MQDWLKVQLRELQDADLLRDPDDSRLHEGPSPDGSPWIDACSNDYLGLGARSVSRETLDSLEGARLGAGASRLVQGSHSEHTALEAELAGWVGAEAALLTLSAFAANSGLLPALASSPETLVVSDALNHASIVDGCRLARGRVVVTPHLDVDAVRRALASRSAAAPAWVVTEGLFSMDGDRPDLASLRSVCDEADAGLIVDEAHSLGLLGPEGAGLGASLGVRADVTVAGLGKAVGSQGGFVGSSRDLRVWLWNRARPFVFSTAPSPALCRLTLAQVRSTRAADAQRERLWQRSAELRSALAERGLQPSRGADGPIIPVLLGSNERALRAMTELRRRGILVQAIRPPTVPKGQARLRLTVHADWPDNAVARIAEALEVVCGS
jgi:8-amino-7-oxononanoate synthase